ncbi:hypothetical protein, partial [Rheinheimera sp.]|uniref:hypothetical protein n=1 Tax=Rheinheimera sp. TaxID=1869214 RepID=UPI004048C78D
CLAQHRLKPLYAFLTSAPPSAFFARLFISLMPTISMVSITLAVLPCNSECTNTSGIAAIKPKAVVFIATEILDDSRLAKKAEGGADVKKA